LTSPTRAHPKSEPQPFHHNNRMRNTLS